MDRIALDVHAHLVPIMPDRLAEGAAWNAEAERLVLDGREIGLKPLFRPEALVAWMDENGVEKAWISIPPLLYRPALAEDAAGRWARYVNDGLAGIAARFPQRFEPMLHLPVERPELAAEIAAEGIAQGRRRFAMPAGAGPKVALSDARYEPLWQRLDAAEAFLFLHPAEGCDPRLDPFYLHNLLGNPTETAVAAGHLVFSGVLARHPGLTICLAHGGGTTAVVAGRLERGLAT
jgi:aminocarboxymuconate-semialdehyde decarboxylase